MNYEKIIEIVKSTKKFLNDETMRNDIKAKGESDFVTGVDLSISSYLHTVLTGLYPEIDFMSEEEDNVLSADTRWILDPIDGTTNLIFDYRMSSVSLALWEKGKIVFGVVYNPFNEELFTAQRGKGAFLNGRKIRVNDRDLKHSLVEFGAGSTHKDEAEDAFENALNVFKNCLDIRRTCSSALAISYIAAGRLNGYFEKYLKPWDYAAASLILEEAGGFMCDWNDAPIQYDVPCGVIVGSPQTYSFLKSTIKR